MKTSITPNQIKETNRNRIYQYIYQKGSVSQQDIAYNLHLSRPTVTTNLLELESDGLIVKGGQIATEYVGRKAMSYEIVPDFRVGIGVEIRRREIKLIAVDLYGREIEWQVVPFLYENTEKYCKTVCAQIEMFLSALQFREEQILGVGFAMQGLVSPDGQTVLYGKILDCTGLAITSFTRYLPYPCSFIHDADSAAAAELWVSPDLTDAFYLSLSRHLGASLIADRKLISGIHGHNSTVEHIQMEPGGQLCYCGKHGCMETLCSLKALLNDSETPETFFEQVHLQNPAACKRWKTYLHHLSRSINLLHLIYDKIFILGGELASFLTEADLVFLYDQIQDLTPFPEGRDFLQISKMPKHNITIGAALPYIREFLNLA